MMLLRISKVDDRASEHYVGERSAKTNTVKEETGEDQPNPLR